MQAIPSTWLGQGMVKARERKKEKRRDTTGPNQWPGRHKLEIVSGSFFLPVEKMTTKPRLRIIMDEDKEFITAKIERKDVLIEATMDTTDWIEFGSRRTFSDYDCEVHSTWRLYRDGTRAFDALALIKILPLFRIWSIRSSDDPDDLQMAVQDRIRWGSLRRLRQRQYLVSRIVLQRKGICDKDLVEHILSFVFRKRDLQLMIHAPWPLKRIVPVTFPLCKMETSLSPVPVPIVAVDGEGSGDKAEKQVRFNDDKTEKEEDKKPHETMDIIDYKDGSDDCYSTLNHHLGGIGAKVDGCGGRIDMPWIVAEAVHKTHPNLEFNDELYGFKLRPCTFDCTALVQYIENGRKLQRMIQQDLVAETERCAIKLAGKLEVRGELKRFGRWLDRRARKRQRREEMDEELKRDFGSSSDEEEDEE